MNVLLVHNYYGSEAPSGENRVFEAEKKLLEQHGHNVKTFTRNSDEVRGQGRLGIVRGGVAVPWNPFSAFLLRKEIDSFQPDVVHVHNTFPLISPAIFYAIGSRAAKVLTLHNYRLLCSAGVPVRNNQVCTRCIDNRSVLPAIQHGCYRSSRVATLPLAASIALHRNIGTWHNKVEAFVTLSEFQKKKMAEGGLPVEKLHVKPNFYAGSPDVVPFYKRSGQVVFVGRLGEEKGVRALIKAWQHWGDDAPELRLIGDGPLRDILEHQSSGLPITFLGQISSQAAQEQIANARLLVLPSECFEGFPMVVREAFAFGTPVAVSNLGPLPSIVEHNVNGVVFEPWDPVSLVETIKALWSRLEVLQRLADGARKSFETLYNEDANYQILMDVYQQAITRNEIDR